LKVECDDWYGRNLDAEQRDDGLKCIEAEKRLALLEEELAEQSKELAEQSKELAEQNKECHRLFVLHPNFFHTNHHILLSKNFHQAVK
jgi:hypothetical protein